MGHRPARPIRSGSSTRAARASASRSATDDGRLRGRPPTHDRAAAPAARRRAPDARAPPRPWRRPRRSSDEPPRASSSGPSRSRSCSRSSRSPSRSACRPPGSTSAGSELDRQRLDDRAAELRSDLNRLGREPAIRKQAIDAGLGQLSEPLVLHAPIGDRATDAGPNRFAPPAPVPARRLRASRRSPSSPAWPTGRSSTASGWPRRRWPRRRVTLDTPSKRGDIFDRTGTVVLATTVQRERLVAAPDQLTPEQRKTTVATLAADPRPRRRPPRSTLRDKLDRQRQVRHPAPRPGPRRRRPDPRARSPPRASSALSLEPEPERVYPQVGGGPGSSLAAHLLGFVNREGGGQYGVEQALPVDARRRAAGRRRRARRQRPGAILDDGDRRPSRATPGTDLTPDHRCRPPAAGRAGAPRRLGRRQGEARLGRRHGPVHRRDLRDGDLSVVRRQRLQGDRRDAIRRASSTRSSPAVYEPGSVFKMMTAAAALTNGHRHAARPGSRTSGRSTSTRARPRSTTPTARGWAG